MNQNLKFLGVVFFGFACAALILAVKYLGPNPTPTTLPPAYASLNSPLATSTPPTSTGNNVVSNSDNSLKLSMRSAKFTDRTDYTFMVSKGDGSEAKLLYTRTVGPGASMSIPNNSWSPDYKEVFLILKDGSLTQYLVFNASGEPYAQGDKFLEITSLFTKSNSNLTLKNVTGWDGYGLLHVETSNPDGTRGPRFWFVTGTRAFLELAPAPNE